MIKIQILDYKYRKNLSGFEQNNLINFNNVTTLPSNCKIVNTSKITWSSTGSLQYIFPVAGALSNGSQYELELTISDYSGSGDIGFSTLLTDGTNDIPADARRSSNGTTVGSPFTAHSNGSPRILCEANTSGSITAKLVRRNTILDDSSIKGVLDIGNSTDFPLALNFSITDVRDLNATTGSYSKTFNIPATKNNNNILKGSYMDGAIINENTITGKKECNIVVDDVYYIGGLLEVVSVSEGENPLYYSCVFYGDNVAWAALLENELLKDLRVADTISASQQRTRAANGSGWDNLNNKGVGTGIGLKILHGASDQYNGGGAPVPPITGIVDTWNVDNALESTPYNGVTVVNTSPVVYTNVGYGERNSEGTCSTQQLLRTYNQQHGLITSTKTGCFGWDSNNNSYGTPVPTVDWRPGIFIYDIIKQIFSQVDYTISSTFIESAMFKKFIMLLPNFKYNNSTERLFDYSGALTFDGTGLIQETAKNYTNVSPVSIKYPQFALDFSANGNDVNSDIYATDSYLGNGRFRAQEAGFYDISSNNIGVNIKDSCIVGGAQNLKIHYLKLLLRVSTVGETGFNTVVETSSVITNYQDSGCPVPPTNITVMETFEGIDHSIYLNKGDEVQWFIKGAISHSGPGNQDFGITMKVWGGVPKAVGTSASSYANSTISFVHQADNASWGQTYDLKNVIGNNYTQVDFLRGVIHAFNLYLTTDVVNRVVTIEPFYYAGDDRETANISDFFYNQNLAVDWTGKVDLSVSKEDKFIESVITNELIFKYKTDSNDKKVEARGKQYWDGILDEFPYREIIGGDAKKGSTIFENPFFAGSYNGNDGMISGASGCSPAGCAWVPYSSLLWGECDTSPPTIPTNCSSCRPPKGFNFQPRLVNYVKDGYDARPMGVAVSSYHTEIEVWGTHIDSINAGIPELDTSNNIIYPILTRAMSRDKYPNFDNPAPLLTYGSVRNSRYNHLLPNSAYILRYDKGLYQTYYQNMIEMLRNPSRLKTVYINLKLSDIVSLDLRRLVYLDGYYYRINRVVDFQPNNNKVTKVELILWSEKPSIPAQANPGF